MISNALGKLCDEKSLLQLTCYISSTNFSAVKPDEMYTLDRITALTQEAVL